MIALSLRPHSLSHSRTFFKHLSLLPDLWEHLAYAVVIAGPGPSSSMA